MVDRCVNAAARAAAGFDSARIAVAAVAVLVAPAGVAAAAAVRGGFRLGFFLAGGFVLAVRRHLAGPGIVAWHSFSPASTRGERIATSLVPRFPFLPGQTARQVTGRIVAQAGLPSGSVPLIVPSRTPPARARSSSGGSMS